MVNKRSINNIHIKFLTIPVEYKIHTNGACVLGDFLLSSTRQQWHVEECKEIRDFNENKHYPERTSIDQMLDIQCFPYRIGSFFFIFLL